MAFNLTLNELAQHSLVLVLEFLGIKLRDHSNVGRLKSDSFCFFC